MAMDEKQKKLEKDKLEQKIIKQEEHKEKEEAYETWSPPAGKFAKLIAILFLVMIVAVIVMMILSVVMSSGN